MLAPYAVLPGGSTLQYEVELIRLSARGPDELTKVGCTEWEGTVSLEMTSSVS